MYTHRDLRWAEISLGWMKDNSGRWGPFPEWSVLFNVKAFSFKCSSHSARCKYEKQDESQAIWGFFKLTYNSCNIKWIIWKYTVKWFFFLEYTQGCTTITIIQFQSISITPRWSPETVNNHSRVSRPLSVSSTFCLYRFADSERFMWMESCSMWPFVFDFFHSA